MLTNILTLTRPPESGPKSASFNNGFIFHFNQLQ